MLQQDFSEHSLRCYLYPSDFIKNRSLLNQSHLKTFFCEVRECLKFIHHDRISLNKIMKAKKYVYLTSSFHHKIILRRCDFVLKKLFEVNIKNRHSIIDELIVFLKESPGFYIYRTDIKSFFESINQDLLLEKLECHKELSSTIYYIVFYLIKSLNKPVGIPRGLEISSSLAEVFLRKFDEKIHHSSNTLYYARFVDDIILISSKKIDADDFFKKHLPDGLFLNNKKTISIELEHYKDQSTEKTLNYLGYEFTFTSDGLSGRIKKKSFRDIKVSISRSKINKIKNNISKSFYAYYNNFDFDLLMDRLHFLSSNRTLLCEKTKRKIPTGIYFNYSKLNTNEALRELDFFIKKIIFDSKLRINKNRRRPFNKVELNKLLKINFEKSHNNIVYKSFNVRRLKEITRIWQ